MKEKNTVPVWAGCFAPFRLVTRTNDNWSASLDEINASTYDTTKLFRTSLNIDVGISPLSLIVLFDGTLVLPMYSQIPKKRALSIFNKHLTDLLLGGLFVKEVAPDDVTPGSLNFWGYHRHNCPIGRYSKLSQSLRMGRSDPDDSIVLLKPQTITETEYLSHHATGLAVSKKLPTNLTTVLLPSSTAYANEEWERALILGWTSIELLIEQLWKNNVLTGRKIEGIKQKRRKDFLSDTRTWSSSTRIELLWQQGHLTDAIYSLVDKARSARNSFIHSATACLPEEARSAIEASLLIIESIALDTHLSFDQASLMSLLDESTNYFRSPVTDEHGRLLVQPTVWRYPDPAPGFEDWGDRPFEKVPEIELKPLKQNPAEGWRNK